MQQQSSAHRVIALAAAVGAAVGIASVTFVGKRPFPDAILFESGPSTRRDTFQALDSVQRSYGEGHAHEQVSTYEQVSTSFGNSGGTVPNESSAVEDDMTANEKSDSIREYRAPDWVQSTHLMGDGCTQVYLDIGSNIGVQVRKLFEPEKYIRGKKTTGIFDAAFGPAEHRRKPFSESGLCAFGFEANPKHVARLKKIEDVYNHQGWRVYFFVPTAVSDADGNIVTLWSNRLSKTRLGASIFHKDKRYNGRPQNVTTMDITKWIANNIKPRSLPQHSHVKQFVLAKMDIEGSEYPVLTRMMDAGLLCKGILDKIFIEWHHMTEAKGTEETVRHRFEDKNRCNPDGKITDTFSLDDESYQLDGMPLPGETTPPPPRRR